MTSWDENEGHSAEGHLPEGKLLLYLDGELPPKEAALVEEHLTACWSCRMNADRVQETVFAFVKYRDEAMRSLAAPPSDEARFARRLEDLRERLGERSWLARLYDSRRRMFFAARLAAQPRPVVWAMAGLVVAFAAIALFTWSDRAPVVTASELLRKASEAEARELGATAQPVVYQKLRIRRGARVATWELWRDTATARFRQSIATEGATAGKSATEGPMRESPESEDAALASELMEVLGANRMNPQQPLSAASFETWRQSLAAKREEISRSQTEAGETLTLRVSADAEIAAGQIAEASLVVRGRDWRPQAQSLKVRGENEIREYEVSETAYEVIPLAALTVFAEPAPAATRIPAAPPLTVATPLAANPLPTSAELQDAEVAALYVLHQLKADLGEQIEIARESNEQIVVRGQVETPQRKQELIAALKGIPFVAARIQTFDEATAQAAPKQPPATIAPLPDANGDRAPDAGVNLFERRLARYFAERAGTASEDAAAINRRIAQMANSAFAESSAALASGYALRRLAEQFDDGSDEQMSVAAAARLREVISNHLAEINTRSRNLRTLLEPALIFIAGTRDLASSPPQPAEGTRKARVMRLFNAVEQVQRLSYRLFDSRQTFATSPEAAARLMLQALDQLDAARLALEQDGHR
jgi:anti-sigma factor RsiW